MEESVCIVLGRGQDLEMQREIGQFGLAIQHKTPNHSTEGSSFNKTSSSESSSSCGAFRDQGYHNGAEKLFLDTSRESFSTEFYSSVCYLLEICCS